jgi:hypothetical protein
MGAKVRASRRRCRVNRRDFPLVKADGMVRIGMDQDGLEQGEQVDVILFTIGSGMMELSELENGPWRVKIFKRRRSAKRAAILSTVNPAALIEEIPSTTLSTGLPPSRCQDSSPIIMPRRWIGLRAR